MPSTLCRVHLVLQGLDELLVAGQHVRAVLDEHAQCPQTKRRLAVLLDDVQVREVHAAAQLADLLDDRVDALREGVLQRAQSGLDEGVCKLSVVLSYKQWLTHLSTAEDLVGGQVKDVLHELGNSIAADPQEDGLAIFNQEKAVPLQSLRGQRKSGRKNNALLADRSSLNIQVSKS